MVPADIELVNVPVLTANWYSMNPKLVATEPGEPVHPDPAEAATPLVSKNETTQSFAFSVVIVGAAEVLSTGPPASFGEDVLAPLIASTDTM